MRRSPTITQSSVFDQSSPRSDGSPQSAPPTQTIFNRRDQPSLSTRSLQPSRTAAPPSSLSPLSQNGGPAPEWLSHPPASRRTPDHSPPLISPTSASTVRRASLNPSVEYDSTSRTKHPNSSSRSSSTSSTRGAKESSPAEGYYSFRRNDSPPIDTATATILRNSPATLSFRSSLTRSDSSTLQPQNLPSPTRESPTPIRTNGQRRVSDKKPPPLRAKSVRRTSAVLRKMASSEDLSSSVDGNQYASADDSSLGGGGFSDLDASDSPRYAFVLQPVFFLSVTDSAFLRAGNYLANYQLQISSTRTEHSATRLLPPITSSVECPLRRPASISNPTPTSPHRPLRIEADQASLSTYRLRPVHTHGRVRMR